MSAAHPKLLTARPLMMCVVLGAFAVALVHVTRFASLGLNLSLPWLSYPAPLPWFVPPIMAMLLIKRMGAALIVGIIGALGGGAAVLMAGTIVELLALLMLKSWRLPIWWAMLCGVLIGFASYGFMFSFPEFAVLGYELKLAALAARIVQGIIYGGLAFWLVKQLRKIGVGGPITQ